MHYMILFLVSLTIQLAFSHSHKHSYTGGGHYFATPCPPLTSNGAALEVNWSFVISHFNLNDSSTAWATVAPDD